MKLKIKFLKWSAGLPVAMMHPTTAEMIGVGPKDHVSIKTLSNHFKQTSTVVDTSELIPKNEISVSDELKTILQVNKGEFVRVFLTPPPVSLDFIKKKLVGERLSEKEIYTIVSDIVSNTLSEAEVAMFVSAMYIEGMNLEETVFMIKAMLQTGHQLNLGKGLIADKHCIGGIPGNRTTPIVVAICAAAGLIIPKSSSRAITSPSGTADVIDNIARVEFSPEEVKKIIYKTGGCLVWGGSIEMITADTKIIQIEKILRLDPESQLLASIISKKLAMGSNHILIDIPCGLGAKVSYSEAGALKKKFETIGRRFGKKVKCVLTDGSQPIGNGIGSIFELLDVLKVLKQDDERPKDLEAKSIFLAGELLELCGKTKKSYGESLAREILVSGKAFSKFKEIIEAQSGSVEFNFPAPKFSKEILAKENFKVKQIDNKKISFLARVLGCPADKSAGIYLHIHKGSAVKNSQKLLTLYSNSESRLNEAVNFCNREEIILHS